jgi:hypothetical protein
MHPKKRLFLFPILAGLYPVIALLASNATEIKLLEGFRSIAVSLVFSIVIYGLFYLFLGKSHKSAIIAALVIVLFFSYGHLHLFLEEMPIFGKDLARIRFLVPLFAVLLTAGSWFILRSKRDLSPLVKTLTIISAVALLLPLSQIGIYLIQEQRRPSLAFESEDQEKLSALQPSDSAPDIYYIILDGYSRADILDTFDYDNTAFIQELETLGFYDAKCSQANYSWTLPSLTSTFNMQSLDDGKGQHGVDIDEEDLYAMLDHNLVRSTLENLGYTVIAFENGFDWLHWYDADQYFSPVGDEEGTLRLKLGMNGFELLFLETTAARLILDTNILDAKSTAGGMLTNAREIHRQRVLFTLETLPLLLQETAPPRFVYAHIVSPHDPYLFSPDGEWLNKDPENTLQAYLDQTTYLNTQIIPMVENIQQNANRPTVIILQGDHGAPINWPEGKESYKLGILNAIYASEDSFLDQLYPDLSPINTFRMIFNYFFDAGLNLLPDTSIIGNSSPLIEIPCQ